MDKWFKAFDEWVLVHNYRWSDLKRKDLWKLFEIDVRNIWKIKPEKKIIWSKLDYNKTRKFLGISYVNEEGMMTDGIFEWGVIK